MNTEDIRWQQQQQQQQQQQTKKAKVEQLHVIYTESAADSVFINQ